MQVYYALALTSALIGWLWWTGPVQLQISPEADAKVSFRKTLGRPWTAFTSAKALPRIPLKWAGTGPSEVALQEHFRTPFGFSVGLFLWCQLSDVQDPHGILGDDAGF